MKLNKRGLIVSASVITLLLSTSVVLYPNKSEEMNKVETIKYPKKQIEKKETKIEFNEIEKYTEQKIAIKEKTVEKHQQTGVVKPSSQNNNNNVDTKPVPPVNVEKPVPPTDIEKPIPPVTEDKPTVKPIPPVDIVKPIPPTTEDKPVVKPIPPTDIEKPTVKPTPPVTEDKPNNQDIDVASFQKQVLELVNKERAKVGLNPLSTDNTLQKSAMAKSKDMAINNYFSHNSPTYGSPFDMMKQFGINYRSAGENIAKGQRTPQDVMNSWLNSEGHRKNILSKDFTHLGVGIYKNSNGQILWTQQFIGR